MSLATKCLTCWEYNNNGTILKSSNKKEEVIKNLYIDFFKANLQNPDVMYKLKNFCIHWSKSFEKFKNYFNTRLSEVIDNEIDKKTATFFKKRIFNKFRGNCGEILIEELIVNCGKFSEYFKDYRAVSNRQFEQFIDATAAGLDKLPVGIQIKNHKEPIRLETFIKADSMWARNAYMLMTEEFKEYKTTPRQFIISFSNKESKMGRHEEFDTRVKFLGPVKINNELKNESSMEQVFKDILNSLS